MTEMRITSIFDEGSERNVGLLSVSQRDRGTDETKVKESIQIQYLI
jgi:hypothetical protein